ncbi:Phage/plasmid primase, P4 family, C-terminal domain (fragment) [Hyella patelloides LEGE 07179]|uniref:Phage/plasmid primase, P4 family, C-terminal domain n=1 Tax=Hyella patelloides LEGE 07179 TaxID=945734 RepID=A0A563VWU2_9CYAN
MQLPRDYTVVEAGWTKIDTWMNEATKGNSEYKELLLCFAAAVLRGRNDLQKFLHLIGGGGSGKSTFTTLLTALVGESNTATMNLGELEDKHEIARIFGKRLVVLPDQDKAPKKMSNFKRLTGQDRLSGRRLFENGFEYVFGGLTVVTSNFPIFHTNLGSWLTRRVSMIPFDYQCPNHKKRDLMKEFEGELGAFTSYLLSIPETRIEAVLKGIGDRSLSTTVWESQIRSEGLAAWVNEWVIQDSTGSVPIGSNAGEWKVGEDYDATCSTLYGSYALYCQQTKRSAKSPQNFSCELLELTNRTLGWLTEKARVKISGKTVRVIKGLKLRERSDTQLTVEEILEGSMSGDNRSDNQGDNQGDNPKPSSNKGSELGDNLYSNFEVGGCSRLESISNRPVESTNINLSDNCDGAYKGRRQPPTTAPHNLTTVTLPDSVENKNTSNNSSQVVTPVTIPIQQKVSAVPEVVTFAVTSVVPSEINWKTYPYNSNDTYTLLNRANKVKERVLDCSTKNDLIKLLADNKASEPEINWLRENYLSISEKQQLTLIENSTQGNLFKGPEPTPRGEIVEYRLSEIIESIDHEMKRLGWSKEQGRQYLMERYNKKSRLHLTDEELLEFWDYLKNLDKKGDGRVDS